MTHTNHAQKVDINYHFLYVRTGAAPREVRACMHMRLVLLFFIAVVSLSNGVFATCTAKYDTTRILVRDNIVECMIKEIDTDDDQCVSEDEVERAIYRSLIWIEKLMLQVRDLSVNAQRIWQTLGIHDHRNVCREDLGKFLDLADCDTWRTIDMRLCQR